MGSFFLVMKIFKTQSLDDIQLYSTILLLLEEKKLRLGTVSSLPRKWHIQIFNSGLWDLEAILSGPSLFRLFA